MVQKFPGVEKWVFGVSGVAECSKISKTLRISTFLPFLPDFQGLQGLQGLQLNTPLEFTHTHERKKREHSSLDDLFDMYELNEKDKG